jgi:hypothetical protein
VCRCRKCETQRHKGTQTHTQTRGIDERWPEVRENDGKTEQAQYFSVGGGKEKKKDRYRNKET